MVDGVVIRVTVAAHRQRSNVTTQDGKTGIAWAKSEPIGPVEVDVHITHELIAEASRFGVASAIGHQIARGCLDDKQFNTAMRGLKDAVLGPTTFTPDPTP